MTQSQARRYPKDSLGRRIRGRRTPFGKCIVLQPRDIEILKLLRRYRFLRSTLIWELLPSEVRGRSFKRFQDRLTDLFHETNTAHGGAYLDWPQQQRRAYNARYTTSIYGLAPAGEAALDETGAEVTNVTDLVKAGRMVVNRDFVHAMMICDTLAAIEIGTRDVEGLRLVPWPEVLRKAPPAIRGAENPFAVPVRIRHRFKAAQVPREESFCLIPDGLFGLEYSRPEGTERYRFFALEAEHRNRLNSGSLKGTSFLKKVLAYQQIIEQGIPRSHFGIPNLLVLTVTVSEARIATMKKVVEAVFGSSGSPHFLFRAIPAVGHDGPQQSNWPNLFSEPWERAFHPPFRLNKVD